VKYNPRPNAGERRHHIRVMELPCQACGVEYGVIAHHILSDAPGKRYRRDHEFVIPLCANPCHDDLHNKIGDEQAFAAAWGFNAADVAVALREASRAKGIL
jgi:hypothetical protein